ncbi:minichromosome maintenance protein 5 [Fusarium proliferatum]|nr:minichromosome maintenance protein 5 [Fusarium proliferatum]
MMDRGSIYSAHVYEPSFGENRDTRLQLQTQLETFILDFRLGNNFVYRDQLRENALLKRYYCDVNINDLIGFNEELAHQLTSEPAEVIPLPLLHSNADDVSIRNLDSMANARLVRVPGIVIGASVMFSKATELHIQCQNCGHAKAIPILGGFTGVTLPRQCARSRIPNDPTPRCPLDPYFIVHEKSQFVDQQIIKLQEAPDQVPVGELPRHVLISADRYLTNRVVPGSRCTVMGIFSIYQNKASKNSSNGGAVAIRTPYLRAVGIQSDIDQAAKGNATFSEEEEQEFLELSRRSDIYNVMAA